MLECENNEYLYISGLEIFKFRTDDKIIYYISFMGNNKIPYAIMLGQKYTYSIAHRHNFIEMDKIAEGTLLNATNKSLDPYNYHVEKSGIDAFNR